MPTDSPYKAMRESTGKIEVTYASVDPINPSHYKGGSVQCIDAIAEATKNLTGLSAVCTANAIKYLWRHQEKGGHADLNKAIWYIKEMMDPGGDHRL